MPTVASPSPHHTRRYVPSTSRTASLSDTAIRWILVLCIAFVAILSYIILLGQSLRLDEAQSLWQSSHTIRGLLRVVATDVHVPLYHLLLHFWQQFFGNDVSVARILSLIFFAACIPMTYLVGKTAYSKRIGLAAALLVTISPFLNWYGSEIRMYSMLTLATLIHQYYFIRILKRGSGWWGYLLTAIIGLFTHYFFAMVLLTETLTYLSKSSAFEPKALRKFVVVAIICAASIFPWIRYVKSFGFGEETRPHLAAPTAVQAFNAFAQFIFGFQTDTINTILVSLWPLVVLFAFLSIRKTTKLETESFYFLLMAVIPLIAAIVISILWQPVFLSRYLILSVPSLYLFLVWVCSTFPRRAYHGLVAMLMLIMSGTLVTQVLGNTTPVKEHYREAAAYLSETATAEDAIAVSAPFTIYPIEYYYRGPAQLATLPLWDRYRGEVLPAFNESTLPEQVATISQHHGRLFVVLSYDQGYEDTIHTYLDTHYQLLETRHLSKDLNVYVYKIRYE